MPCFLFFFFILESFFDFVLEGKRVCFSLSLPCTEAKKSLLVDPKLNKNLLSWSNYSNFLPNYNFQQNNGSKNGLLKFQKMHIRNIKRLQGTLLSVVTHSCKSYRNFSQKNRNVRVKFLHPE